MKKDTVSPYLRYKTPSILLCESKICNSYLWDLLHSTIVPSPHSVNLTVWLFLNWISPPLVPLSWVKILLGLSGTLGFSLTLLWLVWILQTRSKYQLSDVTSIPKPLVYLPTGFEKMSATYLQGFYNFDYTTTSPVSLPSRVHPSLNPVPDIIVLNVTSFSQLGAFSHTTSSS